MERIDAKRYQLHILIQLARLRDDVSRMACIGPTTDKFAPNPESTRMPIHMSDIAADNFDRECELSLLESKEETVHQLEDALDWIELGTYGRCEDCGGRIPKARLAAVPYARRCLKCASMLERGHHANQ
jgi:DnaK suppressor protein